MANLSNSIISKILDLAYNKAIEGIAGIESAYELGNSYVENGKSLDTNIDTLIKWQAAKAATSGLVTGFGGLLAMPLTVPTNIASVMYIQVRMIAAIAHLKGHDLKSDKVKALTYMCMVGSGAKELVKDISIQASEKLITKSIEALSLKIATKAGEKTLSSFSKAIPVIGGVVGCSIDAASTQIVGKIAKNIFTLSAEKTENKAA